MVPARMVSADPFRLHFARSARSTAERKNSAYSQPCAVPRTTTGPRTPPAYFRGTATQISRISRTPTTFAMTRYRWSAAAIACSESRADAVRSAAMGAAPLAERALVEFGEVGVVGGQLRVSRRVDARALVQDDVRTRRPLVGVAVQLDPDHAQVEPQPHEAVERPLQGVAPVHRSAAGLGLGQLLVAEEEGGHEEHGDQDVQEQPLGGQQPGEHDLDSNRRAPTSGRARSVLPAAPPVPSLRWSAAERSRLVSPHTVIAGDAVHRPRWRTRWEDRPERRTEDEEAASSCSRQQARGAGRGLAAGGLEPPRIRA